MTAEEEKNLWARLVALENAVIKLEAETPAEQLEEPPAQPLEPPRDRYGAYGRPEV